MGAALAYRDEREARDRRDRRVELGGRAYDLGELERRMDQRLYLEAIEFAGIGASAQAIVDEYARLHRARYGVAFIFGA